MCIIFPSDLPKFPSIAESGLKPSVLHTCHQLAVKYKLSVDDFKYEICGALLTGGLKVRNPAGLPYRPDFLDVSVEHIHLDDLNAYFKSNGYHYQLSLTDFLPQPDNAKGGAGQVSINEVRLQLILELLTKANENPMNIINPAIK